MERVKIENLLNKYMEAETTLAEEKELRAYFASEQVAPAFADYQSLFGFYAEEKGSHYTKTLELPRRHLNYKYFSVAASIAIIVGTFWWLSSKQEFIGASPKPLAYHEAMQNTQDLLLMMTSAIKTSKKQLNYLKELNQIENQFIQKN